MSMAKWVTLEATKATLVDKLIEIQDGNNYIIFEILPDGANYLIVASLNNFKNAGK